MRVISRMEHRDGFQAFIYPREGTLPFAWTPIDSAVYETREDAQNLAVAMIVEMHDRLGPFCIALIKPFSGMVSVWTLWSEACSLTDVGLVLRQHGREQQEQQKERSQQEQRKGQRQRPHERHDVSSHRGTSCIQKGSYGGSPQQTIRRKSCYH